MNSEQLLCEAIPQIQDPVQSALSTSLGRGELAMTIARRWPDARVACHFLDLFRADRTREALPDRQPPLEVLCTPDFPETECDVVAIPASAHGDGELTRDLLQSGFERLRMGGYLLTATDNPRDQWLDEVFVRLTGKREVRRTVTRHGIVYLGRKRSPLKKRKEYDAEFSFPANGRILNGFSRPSIFSHRRIDDGSRALIRRIPSLTGRRFLDLGCGSGVVAIALAADHPDREIHAIDANPRAIQCTQRGAELNGLTNISAELSADGANLPPNHFDAVLANPPYFSNFQIGLIFLQIAHRVLVSGGRLVLVTKQPSRYCELAAEAGFDPESIGFEPSGRYYVVEAKKS